MMMMHIHINQRYQSYAAMFTIAINELLGTMLQSVVIKDAQKLQKNTVDTSRVMHNLW